MAKDRTAGARDPLVRAVDARFEEVDTLVGARVVRWIEESRLDFHAARVLLALSAAGRAMTAADLVEPTGLDLDSAYRAVHMLHRRGLTCEEARRHKLTARGRSLMRSFAQARAEGVRAYVGSLDSSEQRALEKVLGVERAGG